MTARLALVFSILAAAAAIASFALLTVHLPRLSASMNRVDQRVAKLEAAPAPPAPAAEKPDEAQGDGRREMAKLKGVQAVERQIEADLQGLVKKLELGEAAERRLREAFAPEIAFYLAAVEKSLEALYSENPKEEDDRLASPEFRRELEDLVGQADAKARVFLSAFQVAVYEQWRDDFRKIRYKLE